RAAHRAVWSAVCGGILLPVVTLLGDGALYRHLWRSVLGFDTADALGRRVARAGFERVRVLPLPGWQTGITHTVVARRPTGGREPGSGTEEGEAERPGARSPGPRTENRRAGERGGPR
ncbi:ubiquinone biosynthesis methyltransferase UbiE, partial [Streptomyces sp. NPDC020125]